MLPLSNSALLITIIVKLLMDRSLKKESLKRKTKTIGVALEADVGSNAFVLKLTSFDLDRVIWVSVFSSVTGRYLPQVVLVRGIGLIHKPSSS